MAMANELPPPSAPAALRRAQGLAVTGGRWARAIVRLTALTTVTLVGFTALVVCQAFVGRSSARARRLRQRMFRTWCVLVLRIFGVRVTVAGAPPDGPAMLVTNHLSYLDIAVLTAAFDCVFLARHDLARLPVIGWAASRLGTLFINRRDYGDLKAVNDAIHAVIARGDGLVLFPEGTTTNGHQVGPFRSPVLEPAAALGLAVAYGALAYATPPGEPSADDNVCWWGDATFPPHFWRLLQLSAIDARLAFGPDRVQLSDRKVLAATLQDRVAALHATIAFGEDE